MGAEDADHEMFLTAEADPEDRRGRGREMFLTTKVEDVDHEMFRTTKAEDVDHEMFLTAEAEDVDHEMFLTTKVEDVDHEMFLTAEAEDVDHDKEIFLIDFENNHIQTLHIGNKIPIG